MKNTPKNRCMRLFSLNFGTPLIPGFWQSKEGKNPPKSDKKHIIATDK
jgi:hypothetical protein